MAFGTVTVATESGNVEEYELTRPTTSVGRQPGNDIVLNTAAVSRYHAQFDTAEGKVYIVDLGTVNGTYVNDQPLESNGRLSLNDGDVVQIGDVKMVFSAPTRKRATGVFSLNPIPHEDPRVPIKLIFDEPRDPVAPGAFQQLALVIENKSGEERLFTVEAGGLDAEWIKINRREVRLDPDEQTEVMLSVRPPRRSDTSPGRYPLTVRVAFKDDPAQMLEIGCEIDVLGYSGLGMALQTGREAGQFFLAVQNQGNYPLEVQLGGYQRDQLLGYQFSPARLKIEAGQTVQSNMKVRAKTDAVAAQPVSFAAVARSLDKAGYQAPLAATYSSGGTSPGLLAGIGIPVLLLIGLIGLVVIAAGLYLGRGLLPPELAASLGFAPPTPTVQPTPVPPTPTPVPQASPLPSAEIITFVITPEIVTFGTVESVTFDWEVATAGGVNYELRRTGTTETLEITADNWSTTQLTVSVAEVARRFGWGPVDYELVITGSDGVSDTQGATLTINKLDCTLVPDAAFFERPPLESGPGTPLNVTVVGSVAVAGRLADPARPWVYVWSVEEHAPLGWAEWSKLQCPTPPAYEEYLTLPDLPPQTSP